MVLGEINDVAMMDIVQYRELHFSSYIANLAAYGMRCLTQMSVVGFIQCLSRFTQKNDGVLSDLEGHCSSCNCTLCANLSHVSSNLLN